MSNTFRFKISLVSALLLIAITVCIYLVTVLPLSKQVAKEVDSSVQRANHLVTRSVKLHGYNLVNLAQTFAARKDVINGVQTETEKQRRINTFDAIDQFDKEMRKEGRKADFFGIVDKTGAIIARDLDPNNMYGEKLPFLNVKKALAGTAAKDIWSMKNKMMRAAAAPILVEGKTIGAVVMANEVTAAEAQEERDQFGTQVAYFMNKNIRASSFAIGDGKTEDSAKVSALTKQLLGNDKAPGVVALAENTTSKILRLKLGGEEFLAITGPLPVRLTDKNVGYVVLASLDEAMKPVNNVRWMLLVMGLLLLLLLLGGYYLVARHFVNAEDKLELGVTEVLNGNLEYSFEGVDEFEGLANAINVMLARLLGRPEPGEEEDGEQAWRADVLFVEEVGGEPSEAQLAQQLAAEPEDAYFARLHQEYVAARKEFNLPVDGITVESLTQKLKANEAMLKAKHECSMIRFTVKSEMGKVSLNPIRIK